MYERAREKRAFQTQTERKADYLPRSRRKKKRIRGKWSENFRARGKGKKNNLRGRDSIGGIILEKGEKSESTWGEG